jgi:FAD/FMN-containing dehydrogenase
MEEGSRFDRRALLRRGALGALGVGALAGCGAGARSAATSSATTTTRAIPPSSTTTASSSTPPGPPSTAQWMALRSSLDGELVLPTEAVYDSARLVYDLRFESATPAAVAYAASATDVQRLVDFARAHGLAPIPRSGGHSYGGYSTGAGLVIDVGRLDGVSVDGGLATVGAGTRLVDLYSACAAAGVLVPGGSCPTVGVAGLALGGGVGVLGRRYGLTADAMRSLTVVTADARVLHVDGGSEPDLYWASRGGGGRNFAIATSFAFATAPVPPLALFTLEYPWAAAGDVLGAWAGWIDGAPDELWSNCLLLSAGSSGLIARLTGVYVGEPGALADLLTPLRSSIAATPTTDFLGADTYLHTMLVEAGCAEITLAQCQLSTPGGPGTLARSAFAAKSAYFAAAPPAPALAAMTAALERFQSELPSLGGGLAFDAYGGAINAVAPGDTAFVHRSALCQLQMSASWGASTSSSTVAAAQAWLAETAAALAPYTNGEAYQNYIDPTLENWPAAYYGANLPRLEQVKLAYDPDDVFSFAQSIAPPA